MESKDKMDAPIQTRLQAADVYRALMVMRADFDLLGQMMADCTDLRAAKAMVQLKVDDSAILMTQVSKVRSRFSGFEMLGMVAPVPAEFLPSPTDTEPVEAEDKQRLALFAALLELHTAKLTTDELRALAVVARYVHAMQGEG